MIKTLNNNSETTKPVDKNKGDNYEYLFLISNKKQKENAEKALQLAKTIEKNKIEKNPNLREYNIDSKTKIIRDFSTKKMKDILLFRSEIKNCKNSREYITELFNKVKKNFANSDNYELLVYVSEYNRFLNKKNLKT